MLSKAREALVEMRTKLVNLLRGLVKSFGLRLPACDAKCFLQRAAAEIRESLQETCAARWWYRLSSKSSLIYMTAWSSM